MALSGLLFNGGLKFPEKALDLALSQPDSPALLSAALRGITGKDAGLAASYLTDPSIKSAMTLENYRASVSSTSTVLARTNLDAALDWIQKLEPADQAVATESIASVWIASDPIPASGWISELPESESREAAVRKLIDELHVSDPAAAKVWEAELKD